MGLGQSRVHTAEVFEPKTFVHLREQLDPAWIVQAVEDTGTVTVRRRIGFVTSLPFIREQWWTDSQVGVSVGAIPAYLERLGPVPIFGFGPVRGDF